MANLLPRHERHEPFALLDAQRLARFAERARPLVAAGAPALARLLAAPTPDVVADLEELQSAASLDVAEALLAHVDAWRRAHLGAELESTPPDEGGRWLCHRPGRSLVTGEAEVASRGFFDVLDRPPLAFWVEAIARRANGQTDRTSAARAAPRFEIAILCYVPAARVDLAVAGCEACPNGSLGWLDALSEPLGRQIRSLFG